MAAAPANDPRHAAPGGTALSPDPSPTGRGGRKRRGVRQASLIGSDQGQAVQPAR